MPLPTRKIGGTDVSAIGYGAMGIAICYGPPLPDEQRLKVLDAAYERGCNYWDTADVYADSEVILGKWFKERPGKRDDIFLATKFGVGSGVRHVYGAPEYVMQACEKSLKRLGVDHIDLYYAHRIDSETPIELTVGAMKKLVEAGKVRHIGLCECSASTLRRAHAVHPIAAVQLEYSPFTLDSEDPKLGLIEACRELGVTIVAYSPLGRGMLGGKITSPDQFAEDDFRRFIPKYSKENFPNILNLVDNLNAVAKKYNATPGQVALAWVLAQGENIILIPGSTKIQNIEENLGAVNLQLSLEDLQEVRKAAETAQGAGQGFGRYPPGEYSSDLFANSVPLSK